MSGSFFKNLAVTYWTGQIYNDTNADIDCEIDEEFTSPLLDAASNYVCAVERMELSGNNIFFYSVDAEATSGDNKGASINAANDNRVCTTIWFCAGAANLVNSIYTMNIYGTYFSLGSLIDSLNYWKRFPDGAGRTMEWMLFSLTPDGKIRMTIQNPYTKIADEPADPLSECKNQWGDEALGMTLLFQSRKLASIFGLPMSPSGNPKVYFNTYSCYTPLDKQCFETKSSRVDCGIIPTMVQLRSTLPFESDQVSSTKTNIVTDFSIVAGSSGGYALEEVGNTLGLNVSAQKVQILKKESVSLGMGSMLVYTPAERRWLNFSAPIPIYNLRMWIEVIYNDPDEQRPHYQIPPGGKFSIKLGFYLRTS